MRSVEQRSDIEIRGYQGGRGKGLGEGPWEVCGGESGEDVEETVVRDKR